MTEEASNSSTVEQTTEQSSIPDARHQEKPKPTLQPFFESLSTLIPKDELSSSCRVVDQGLFIQLGFEGRITHAYQEWLRKETDGAVVKSEEKSKRRLFDSLDPPLYYLLEGSKCLVGVVVKEPISRPQGLGIPIFRGMALEALDYIHPKDPILKSITGLELGTSREGPTYKFPVQDRSVCISLVTLKSLRSYIHDSRKLSRIVPGAAGSLRGTLEGIIGLLGRASEIKPEHRVLVPARFKNNKEVRYLRFGPIVLVLSKDGLVLLVYSLEGRTFDEFLKQEFRGFPKLPKNDRIHGFEPETRAPYAIGCFKWTKYFYPITARAFREFYDQLRESPGFKGVLTGNHTVVDCIKHMTPLFLYGEWEKTRQDRSSHRNNRRSSKRQKHYRISKDWVFVSDDRGTILSFRAKQEIGAPTSWRRKDRRKRVSRH